MQNDRPIISVTDSAAGRIRHLLASRSGTPAGLRLSLRGRGCAGFSYDFAFADAPMVGDEVVAGDGFTVYVDPMAVMFLVGTTVDYEDTPLKSGFVFRNPNEVSRCGCGESFSVDVEKASQG